MTDFCINTSSLNAGIFPQGTIMTVFKGVTADAGHYLNSTELTPEQNSKVFGRCNAEHGHRFNILVEIEGPVIGPHYMVIELSTLKEKMLDIVNNIDHFKMQDNLNLATDDTLQHRVPATGEHFCMWFYQKLNPFVRQLNPDARIKTIKIQLSPDHGVKFHPQE